MKNHAAATVRNRILKGAALCGVLALSMTLTGCFVPPDDLSGDLSNQGVVYNTVAVTAPPRTATPTPSPTPTVESVFNFGTNTTMPTTQPGVITSNGIVTVVTTPPGSVATTARPTATPTPTAAAVLKKGSSGADVKTLQRRLKQLGYYTGSVDGDFGDATEKALRAFQDRNNLLVDGIAGKSTMAKLNSSNAVKAAAATATPRKTATPKPKTTATPNLSTEYYLQSGSSGTRVRTLQARLIELGWMAGSPDGNYEGATEYAVKAFQKKYKSLYTDGVAGPSTLQTLYSSSAAKSSTPVSSIGTTLESGMKNSGAVKAMQTRLKSLGYLTGTADGSFGDATKAAVIAFQTANGLKADGKARCAVVLPDNVLFAAGDGASVRRELMNFCNLHTILRLPTGIFYAQGVKTNVLFFTRGTTEQDNTTEVAFYDMRTNMDSFGKTRQLRKSDFDEFVAGYEDPSKRTGERWSKFTREEIAKNPDDSLDLGLIRDDSIVDYDDLPDPVESGEEAIANLEEAVDLLKSVVRELRALTEEK